MVGIILIAACERTDFVLHHVHIAHFTRRFAKGLDGIKHVAGMTLIVRKQCHTYSFKPPRTRAQIMDVILGWVAGQISQRFAQLANRLPNLTEHQLHLF